MAADDMQLQVGSERAGESFEIFWTRDESIYNSDSETERNSFVPGVDQPIKKRQDTRRMKPARQTVTSRSGDLQGRMNGAPSKPVSSRNDTKREAKTPIKAAAFQQKDKPSLKDLCPEDKKRIANLIKELAKVGEEKEVIVQQLSVERRTYEECVEKLHQQLSAIIQERELTQKQYLECQKLLAEYQSQLASEQEKVASSLRVASSPLKFNTIPQPAVLQRVDNVSVAKYQPFTPPSRSEQRTSIVANPQVASQRPTPIHPEGVPRNGYQYLKAHPENSRWYKVPRPLNAREPVTEGRKQPLGTHPHPQPSNEMPHQAGTRLPQRSSAQPPPSDPEFNPLLASTDRSRPSKDHRYAQQVRSPDKLLYSSYRDTKQPGENTQQHNQVQHQGIIFSGNGQGMIDPRDHLEEFRPLKTELEMEFESRIGYYPDASSWNRTHGFVPPSSTSHGISSEDSGNGDLRLNNNRRHLQTAGAQNSAQQIPPEVHRTLLERQRDQLREEQAWLQQKLQDQEMKLLEKQRQLAAHRLNPLDQEQKLQNHPRWQPPILDPQINSADIEWEEPNILNGFNQKASSGSEKDSDSDAVSTNFPPEGFERHSQAKTPLEDSIRRLDLDQNNHKNRNTQHTNRRNFRRYASLYPETNSGSRIQGSTSSATPSTLSSPHSQPALVDRSTSPLFRDNSSATSDRAVIGSPGRAGITPAPQHGHVVKLMQIHRPVAKRAVSLPSRPGPYRDATSMRKSNVTHLSDIIAEMELPPHARQGYPTTPDLFNEDQVALYTDTDAEQQETKILEDIFFL